MRRTKNFPENGLFFYTFEQKYHFPLFDGVWKVRELDMEKKESAISRKKKERKKERKKREKRARETFQLRRKR